MSTGRLQELDSRVSLPGLAQALLTAAERSADPEQVGPRCVDVLDAVAAADAERLSQAWAEQPALLTRVLMCLCGAAPFFVPHLIRHPEWLTALAAEDLSQPRRADEYESRLSAAMDAVPPGGESEVLRWFKYYELARITVRDLSADLVPEARAGETLAELSHLADALLAQACRCAARRLAASGGPPCWTGADGTDVTLAFTVLALGKHGAQELNYSSDVDLIYVTESPRESLRGGPRGMGPDEYFTLLAQEFGRLVTRATSDGFLYRIDLDLRPEGSQSPLVVSSDRMADYYELWVATWEKAAFMKARPVAGDIGFGWRVIREISPMIYRSTMDFATVAAIREMKRKIEQARAGGAGFDVKIGAGGIRDIEFVAQALQLLHGGRIPQVRARSTEGALHALAEVGVLRADATADLLAAYRFLRRTENRLQMQAERQTYRLPEEPAALTRIARAMGFLGNDAAAAFDAALAQHRHAVRQRFKALFPDSASDRIVELFARNAPQLLVGTATRAMVEQLAAHFASEIDGGPDPERAMANLDRFIQGIGRRRFYYELLIDRPELIPRLAGLFAASEYLSGYFATHPRLIESVFSDPKVLLLSRAQLEESLGQIRAAVSRDGADDIEVGLDALRLFHNRELLNVGLLDLAGKVSRAETDAALTEIAEVCIEHGLVLAQASLRQRRPGPPRTIEQGEFLVVGMGKLASHELTYGSDLDVVFLYDVPSAEAAAWLEAQEYYVRLAQKLIWALQARTREGVCYQIDARLRPSGSQGMLVTSLASFDQYHQTIAQVWERQALLRARPVAGGARLAAAFEARRGTILRQPLPDNLRDEIHRIRVRMESELGRETARRHDFKTGRGGQLDVEAVAQYLQLLHGPVHPELLAPDGVAVQLARLEQLGILAPAHAATLRGGWEFLQRLSSRLRIVENRSISDLDEERGDLDALARRLGYAATQRAGGARRALLEDYRSHTDAIRAVYSALLGVDAP